MKLIKRLSAYHLTPIDDDLSGEKKYGMKKCFTSTLPIFSATPNLLAAIPIITYKSLIWSDKIQKKIREKIDCLFITETVGTGYEISNTML